MGVNATALIEVQQDDGSWKLFESSGGTGRSSNQDLNQLLWDTFEARMYRVYRILGGNDRSAHPEEIPISKPRGWPPESIEATRETGDPHGCKDWIYDDEIHHTWFTLDELMEEKRLISFFDSYAKICQMVQSTPKKTRVLLCWDY